MKDQTTRALGRPRRRLPTAVIIICAALGVVLGGVGAYYVFRDREEEPGRRRRSRRSRDDEDSSRRRVEPFRDEQVQLARVDSAPAAGPGPHGYPLGINVTQDGSVRLAGATAPAGESDIRGLLLAARRGTTTYDQDPVILRCDGRARWRDLAPLLSTLVRTRTHRFWFAVQRPDAAEGFIYFELRVDSVPSEVDAEPVDEIWIRLTNRSAEDSIPNTEYQRSDAQSVTIDEMPMQDMAQVRSTLRRLADGSPKQGRRPTVLHDLVILAPGPNVPCAWVIEAIGHLKALGYADIAFQARLVHKEVEESEDIEVPITDPNPPREAKVEEDPGLDVDLPPAEEPILDFKGPFPKIDPPSKRPIIAFETDRSAYSRRIYSGRNRRGRMHALGRGKHGTTARAEGAVEAGLKWLARAQEKDGRWDCKRWHGGDHDVGTTGLALLAFLGAGYTHTKGKYKTTVSKGLSWLAANQKPTGAFGYRTFYEQGIATIAVAEAYGLTRSPKVGRMAQKALDFIVGQQPDHGGYRYRGACPKAEGDLSVTGWQILAVKSAICSELRVGPKVVERCRVFLKNSYAGHGKSKYTVGSGAPGSPAIWAIGLCARQFLGGDYDEEIRAAADALLDHGKQAGAGQGSGKLVGDLYYTYYSVLGMYQMGEPWWPLWNEMFRKPLVNCITKRLHDEKGRYVRGSWDPKNHKWASRGGRVYATAMAVLCLEVYYRFLPIYRKRK